MSVLASPLEIFLGNQKFMERAKTNALPFVSTSSHFSVGPGVVWERFLVNRLLVDKRCNKLKFRLGLTWLGLAGCAWLGWACWAGWACPENLQTLRLVCWCTYTCICTQTHQWKGHAQHPRHVNIVNYSMMMMPVILGLVMKSTHVCRHATRIHAHILIHACKHAGMHAYIQTEKFAFPDEEGARKTKEGEQDSHAHCIVMFYVELYYTILYCTVLYCTILTQNYTRHN